LAAAPAASGLVAVSSSSTGSPPLALPPDSNAAAGDVALEHLDGDELSRKLPDRGHQLVLVTRQESTVQGCGGGLRDDIVLVAGLEHRQRGGVLQGAEDEPAGPSQVSQNRLR